jgi:hypothetical protein
MCSETWLLEMFDLCSGVKGWELCETVVQAGRLLANICILTTTKLRQYRYISVKYTTTQIATFSTD